jgi:hypothetical protein
MAESPVFVLGHHASPCIIASGCWLAWLLQSLIIMRDAKPEHASY